MNGISHQETLLGLLNQTQATLDNIFFQLDEEVVTVSEEALDNMRSVL